MGWESVIVKNLGSIIMQYRTASLGINPEPGPAAGDTPIRASRIRPAPTQEPSRPNLRSQTGWLLAACLLLLAIGGTLTGCGGNPEIETLLNSGPTVFDTEAHSVKIVAISSLPIVCVVSWGPTTDYGLTSTDADMVGAGHTDHHHVLLGLQPDTEYHFRFSGIGPRGEGYRSKDYAFRTPPS